MQSLLNSSIPSAKLSSLLAALEAEQRHRSEQNKLERYAPYTRQREFHAAGRTHRERLFMAGNQLGKTWAGGFEAAMHATGRYPDWWEGIRFDKPNVGYAASESMELSRDGVQRVLLGREESRGTGAIPGKAVIDIGRYPNVKDAASMAKVRHDSGGTSVILFKSYDQGRTKFQADTIDWGWMDEEPPIDVYTEMLTRTNSTLGPLWITFTPLKGMSEVVRLFLYETEVPVAA